jgi:hypothetical protein
MIIKTSFSIITLGIAVFIMWTQLLLCAAVFQVAQNMYEVTDVISNYKCKCKKDNK